MCETTGEPLLTNSGSNRGSPRAFRTWMPHYFFHLFNDETVLDDEGQEFVNDAAAMHQGVLSARAMAADSVRDGRLVLEHRIDVAGNDGRKIGSVYFRDVVKVEGR